MNSYLHPHGIYALNSVKSNSYTNWTRAVSSYGWLSIFLTKRNVIQNSVKQNTKGKLPIFFFLIQIICKLLIRLIKYIQKNPVTTHMWSFKSVTTSCISERRQNKYLKTQKMLSVLQKIVSTIYKILFLSMVYQQNNVTKPLKLDLLSHSLLILKKATLVHILWN